MGVEEDGGTTPGVADQRPEARHQRGQRLSRRKRTFQQRVLQDPGGGWIDFDRDDIHGGRGGVRFEIQAEQRPQDPRIAQRHRQRDGARMRRAVGQAKCEMKRDSATIGALQRRGQRVEQAREHE